MVNPSQEEIKTFCVRLPKTTWHWLKKRAVEKDIPMSSIILDCLEKLKNKSEKKG